MEDRASSYPFDLVNPVGISQQNNEPLLLAFCMRFAVVFKKHQGS